LLPLTLGIYAEFINLFGEMAFYESNISFVISLVLSLVLEFNE